MFDRWRRNIQERTRKDNSGGFVEAWIERRNAFASCLALRTLRSLWRLSGDRISISVVLQGESRRATASRAPSSRPEADRVFPAQARPDRALQSLCKPLLRCPRPQPRYKPSFDLLHLSQTIFAKDQSRIVTQFGQIEHIAEGPASVIVVTPSHLFLFRNAGRKDRPDAVQPI